MEKFSEKRRIGNIGESIAEMFLVKRGHKILEKNYLKKWGELDLITKKDGLIHFIEVKSMVSRENDKESVSRYVSRNCFTDKNFDTEVSRETGNEDYLLEDNVNYWKQKRMIRAIQTYLLERNIEEDQEWQIDVLTVKMDFLKNKAIIKHIENVVFDA